MNYDIFVDYPDVITIQELQEMLKIGKNKAYELIKDKKIKTISLGRKYIIPKQNVIEFLNAI